MITTPSSTSATSFTSRTTKRYRRQRRNVCRGSFPVTPSLRLLGPAAGEIALHFVSLHTAVFSLYSIVTRFTSPQTGFRAPPLGIHPYSGLGRHGLCDRRLHRLADYSASACCAARPSECSSRRELGGGDIFLSDVAPLHPRVYPYVLRAQVTASSSAPRSCSAPHWRHVSTGPQVRPPDLRRRIHFPESHHSHHAFAREHAGKSLGQQKTLA